ncbi:hypothetical protein M404DRAFT_436421 [Pisolithus tinctorius Marx 270]|uniref:Uncharacterized protein n=1 Tax=Pisolithus tinctorius Marx 270 TaxID=870435 RepID=A0A0C3PEF6_PISTI|nr:hypothetical protein M404DRAFT_436421 [Pisolithus tinctorius Marx 270]
MGPNVLDLERQGISAIEVAHGGYVVTRSWQQTTSWCSSMVSSSPRPSTLLAELRYRMQMVIITVARL